VVCSVILIGVVTAALLRCKADKLVDLVGRGVSDGAKRHRLGKIPALGFLGGGSIDGSCQAHDPAGILDTTVAIEQLCQRGITGPKILGSDGGVADPEIHMPAIMRYRPGGDDKCGLEVVLCHNGGYALVITGAVVFNPDMRRRCSVDVPCPAGRRPVSLAQGGANVDVVAGVTFLFGELGRAL
jgi:hypothetical protein